MSARQQFIELIDSAEVSLAQLALLAMQILKGDGESTQVATDRALAQLATLVSDARAAGCEESLERLVAYVGAERGYVGNAQNYYSADNSDLSLVLERRQGIPITLAIIYIELGKALGLDLRGIGFPGHFLVGHYLHRKEATLIDPYAGQLTDRASCLKSLARTSARPVEGDSAPSPDWPQAQIDAWFLPATAQQIALRLLENLKQIYLQARAGGQALAAIDLQLLVAPDNFELLQQQKSLTAQIFGRNDKPPVH